MFSEQTLEHGKIASQKSGIGAIYQGAPVRPSPVIGRRDLSRRGRNRPECAGDEEVGEALLAIQNRRFSDGSTKFPVRSKTFPVSAQKFPVPLPREFGCKPLNSLAEWARKSRWKVGIFKIPC